MRSDDSRHLTGSECETLLAGSGDLSSGWEWEDHVAGCTQCAQFLESYKAQTNRLKDLASAASTREREDCPPREQWLRMAVGLETEQKSSELLDHAASCDVCGASLRIAVEDLNLLETPAPVLSAMDTAFAERVARQLYVRNREVRGREAAGATPHRWRWGLVLALSAALGVIALLFIIKPSWVFTVPPEQMLAKAYEANRTWPVRFPGASYTPQVSSARSEAPRNTMLIEAEAAISRGLDREPRSLRWNLLESRTEFLRHRYDAAVASLQALTEKGGAPVLTDLGTVYLVRGMAEDSPGDEEKAVESLSAALRLNPNDRVALFNRAVALEALFLWDRATEDWDNYLRLDSQGGWAAEARQRRGQIAKKKATGARN